MTNAKKSDVVRLRDRAIDTPSEYEVRAYLALKQAGGRWLTAAQIATAASISVRSAQGYGRKFASLGLAEVAKISAGFRYHLSENARERNPAHVHRLESACAIFGLEKP